MIADPGRAYLLGLLACSGGASGLVSMSPSQERVPTGHVRGEALVVVLAHESPRETARALYWPGDARGGGLAVRLSWGLARCFVVSAGMLRGWFLQ